MNDLEMLQTYAKTGDEASFRALAEKYTGLVFGCAFRKTGSRQLAEEVTQNVFASLARKASGLRVERSLGAWLHRAAVLESSSLLRSECRHRRRVQALANHTAQEPEMHATPDSELLRSEVASELDEALNQLRAGDRRALLLRFFEDRSYNEIGRELGRSEDACRKRVNRSLDQLAGLLSKSGSAVSTTTIGAVLTAAFNMIPPPILAATATKSAMTSAASLSPLAKTLTLIQIMTYSKMSGLAAGVAFCLLCGTGGYVAGKIENRKRAKDVAFLSDFGATESAPTVIDPPVDAPTQATRDESVAILLETAAAHFRESENTSEAYRRGASTLAKLKVENVEEAVRFLDTVEDEKIVWEGMLVGVLTRWIEADPKASLDYATRVTDGTAIASRVFGELAFAWSKRDHAAAFDWFRDNEVPTEMSHQHVRQRLYEGWLQTDAAAAVASVEELPIAESKEVVASMAQLVGNDVNRANLLLAIQNMQNANLRSEAIGQAIEEWGRYTPDKAGEWFDTLAFDDDSHRVRAATMLVEEWVEKDATVALDWIWPKISESSSDQAEEMREELLEFAEEQWREQDPEASAVWLERVKK
jgi:RNA polymerase sigma factor (sigma-70 family)